MIIGIIGMGVVGKATHNMIQEHHEVYWYDINGTGLESIGHLVAKQPEAIFISVPTPTKNGEQDILPLRMVLMDLDLDSVNYQGLIVIKSTVLPSNIRDIINEFPNLNIMVAPEFLNQSEPYFAHQKHLIGVNNINQAKIYRDIFGLQGYGHEDVRTTDPVTACMVKYTHNVHGALKVTFFNEIADICEKEKVDYREMIGAMLSVNDNVGAQYTRLSSDGKRGYAGCCFPKDTVAFYSEYLQNTLKSAIDTNLKYRPDEMKEVLGGKDGGEKCLCDPCSCGK